jgi:hypothetical protein
MPHDLEWKAVKLKHGDIKVRTRGDLTAILWRDQEKVRMLTNIHAAPAGGNFRDEQGKPVTPLIVADYNQQLLFLRNGNEMANNYTISRRRWKWTKKLFFHLLDLAVLNSYVLLLSCGGKKMSHRDFRISLVTNLLAHAGQVQQIERPMGRPVSAVTRVSRLEYSNSEHWPVLSKTRLRCRVCSVRRLVRKVITKCLKCGVGLCTKKLCFMEYHTKEQL